MRPFFRYYGGKWRASGKLYPAPDPTLPVIEPFAGAAGYSTRHDVEEAILCDVDSYIISAWHWLIGATSADVMDLPIIDADHDAETDVRTMGLDAGQEALLGYWLQNGGAAPRRTLSAWGKRYPGRVGFTERIRERIASQVPMIKGWTATLCSYEDSPKIKATRMVDPPYFVAGKHYRHGSSGIDYARLASWCREQDGPIIVCEGQGADWLPFGPVGDVKANSSRGKGTKSKEVAWMRHLGGRS